MKKHSPVFTLSLMVVIQALVAAPPIDLQTVPGGYRFRLHINDPVLKKEAVSAVTRDGTTINETFVSAYVYGFESEGLEGDPALLSSGIEFAFETNPPRVKVADVVTREIALEGKLYPVQPSHGYDETTSLPFAYNPESYDPKKALAKKSSSMEYVAVTQTYTYRGQESATIAIRPMRYDPGTNKITVVREMTVDIQMEKPQIVRSLNSKAFDQVMRASYVNLVDAAPEPFSAKEKYLILAMPAYKDCAELQQFIDYRARLYDVKVVSTADVGGTTVDAFRTFIRNEMPAFCLLVGNQPTFPSWNKTGWKSFNYYVATQTSSSREPKPDIALGLFYVDNATQIKNIVNKIMATEKSLATRPRVVLAQGGNTERMDNLPPEHCDKIVEEVVTRYFLKEDGWTINMYPTGARGEGAKNAIELFNKGCWFNFYNGHGFADQQQYGWGSRDLSSMTNTVYPFVLNCACETGDFDQGCVASTAVRSVSGPVTMIGAYGTSTYGQHIINQGYPHGIMVKKITRSGLSFVYGVNYDSVPQCYINWMGGVPGSWDRATMGWQYHHFGDPAIETMVSMPMLSITAPGNNEQVEQGKTCRITWSSNRAGKVAIYLYKGGKPVSVLSAATDAASGAYDWTPDGSAATGTDYQIRLTSVDSSALWDTSGTFSIIPEYLLIAPYRQSFDTLDSGSTVLPLKYTQTTDTGDVLDWLVWKGPTPSRAGSSPDTGPQGDKTSGSGNYLYIEASGENSPDKKAMFTTPNFDLRNGDHSLSFWVHMFSATGTMGVLTLDVCVDGTWKTGVLEVTGDQGDRWVEQKVDLKEYAGERVGFRFRGVTGSDRASDICIDDFTIGVTGKTNGRPPVAVSPERCELTFTGSKLLLKIPEMNGSEPVSIMLYNSRGQLIRRLFDGKLSAGEHLLAQEKLTRGLYIVRMGIGGYQKTIELLHAK